MKKYFVILVISVIGGAIITGCGAAAEGNNTPSATTGSTPEAKPTGDAPSTDK